MNVLVFSPHPDDDLLGCGGSIIKHIKHGNKIVVVYMTSGESGSLKYAKEELAKKREEEIQKASSRIGINKNIFLKEEDGYLSLNKNLLIKTVNLLRSERPDVVYIPHGDDNHHDHRITYQVVKESILRAAMPCFQECAHEPWSVQTVLCYEVWTPLQNIAYVEDITEFMDIKMEALAFHGSQIERRSFHEGIKGLNRYRGVMTNQGFYCECFDIIAVKTLFKWK